MHTLKTRTSSCPEAVPESPRHTLFFRVFRVFRGWARSGVFAPMYIGLRAYCARFVHPVHSVHVFVPRLSGMSCPRHSPKGIAMSRNIPISAALLFLFLSVGLAGCGSGPEPVEPAVVVVYTALGRDVLETHPRSLRAQDRHPCSGRVRHGGLEDHRAGEPPHRREGTPPGRRILEQRSRANYRPETERRTRTLRIAARCGHTPPGSRTSKPTGPASPPGAASSSTTPTWSRTRPRRSTRSSTRSGPDAPAVAKPLFGTTATHAAALFALWGDEQARAFFQGLRKQRRGHPGGERDGARSRRGGRVRHRPDGHGRRERRDRGPPARALAVPPTRAKAAWARWSSRTRWRLLKAARIPKAARPLIDFLLSPEVEAQLAGMRSIQIPLNPGVTAPDTVPVLGDIKWHGREFRRRSRGNGRQLRVSSNRSFSNNGMGPVMKPGDETRLSYRVCRAAVALVFAAVVLVPVAMVLLRSVWTESGFGIGAYRAVLVEPRQWTLLGNTLKLAGATAFMATVLGAPFGFALEYLRVPGRRLLMLAAAAAFLIPPYTTVIAWVDLLGEAGVIAKARLGDGRVPLAPSQDLQPRRRGPGARVVPLSPCCADHRAGVAPIRRAIRGGRRPARRQGANVLLGPPTHCRPRNRHRRACSCFFWPLSNSPCPLYSR